MLLPKQFKMKKINLTLLLIFSTIYGVAAQVGIGTTTPAPGAILDLTATEKALLLTRVADVNLVKTPVSGMIVYDISNNCIRAYENGAWSNCLNGTAATSTTGGTAIVSAYVCNTASAGTMTAGTPVSGVTQTITATVTNVGTYNIATTANGVTFAGSGTFAGTGAQTIVLTATGTPTATGANSFTLNTTPNCNFSRSTISSTSNGTAVVSAYTCNTASAGTMTAGAPVSGVTQTITATVTTAGTYSISTTANGVTFARTGTFSGTGARTIVLNATGTPTSAVGSPFTYALNTTPSCSFTRVTNSTDVVSATGKTWMDRNLGASRVAISSTDASAYGHLYQWGRLTDGHELRTSGTTSTSSSTDNPGHGDFIVAGFDWRSPRNPNLWQGVNGVNNPCPSGYRLPTEAEWDAERMLFTSQDAAGAFNSVLKLPAAGYRGYINGQVSQVGTNGYYWASTAQPPNSGSSSILGFNASIAYITASFDRGQGATVRCIKD